ncbi:MAG: ElyC/SanA/YdcF family protein [Bulleidia sp.]|jgi:uncharacterized SAM-binding protein YcdF (DUF218 family)|nr:ElyC/SanA/YdcF family protein [Bulleidia sp.]
MIYFGCILLLFYILPLFLGCSFNFGNVFGFILSGACILYGMFGNVYIGIFLLLNGIVIGLTLCFMFSACFQKAENDETVLILGCGLYGFRPSRALMQRMDRAIQYLNISPVSNVIVSGGQGRNEDISEAEAMYTYLIEHGISKERIYVEDQSTNTEENVLFSKKIIEENSLSKEIAVSTQEFHMYRASLLVKSAGMSFHALCAWSTWYSIPVYFTREVLAVWKCWTCKMCRNTV